MEKPISPSSRVLALLGHGARDPAWAEALLSVRAKIHARDPACRVELAFLEHLPPNLETLLASLQAAGGVTHVHVLPMFIAAGGHMKRDLPARIARLQTQFPQIHLELVTAIGLSESVQEAMSEAALRGFLDGKK
ncbi:MAG: CbiX/SirB N-terminal domain-containing protein [Zoogloeaceae bacterium]|jgi:sirohydrochlorin cobaltochelatase|nr:CbiX/SirB N-terminal domain-containing protein [Zoogloeaceae bacterium]